MAGAVAVRPPGATPWQAGGGELDQNMRTVDGGQKEGGGKGAGEKKRSPSPQDFIYGRTAHRSRGPGAANASLLSLVQHVPSRSWTICSRCLCSPRTVHAHLALGQAALTLALVAAALVVLARQLQVEPRAPLGQGVGRERTRHIRGAQAFDRKSQRREPFQSTPTRVASALTLAHLAPALAPNKSILLIGTLRHTTSSHARRAESNLPDHSSPQTSASQTKSPSATSPPPSTFPSARLKSHFPSMKVRLVPLRCFART